jgi:hypothetical protein
MTSRSNIECGTEGLECAASTLLPFITSSYEYYAQSVNSTLPCTVKSFPYLAVHCLQHAQGEFAFEFSIVPHAKNVARVLKAKEAPKEQENYLLIVERIALSLLHIRTFEDCMVWGRQLCVHPSLNVFL